MEYSQWIVRCLLLVLIHQCKGGEGEGVTNDQGLDNTLLQDLMERVKKLEEECAEKEELVKDPYAYDDGDFDFDPGPDARTPDDGDFNIDSGSRSRTPSDSDSRAKSRHKRSKQDEMLDNLPGHTEALKQAQRAVFLPHPDSKGDTKDTKDQAMRDEYQKQLQIAISMIHKQAAQIKNDHSQLQFLSDIVHGHTKQMERMSEDTLVLQRENQRLSNEVQRLQASLDLYKIANDNFVNHTNGIIKRIRGTEQSVEELFRDQAGVLGKTDDLEYNINKLTKSYRRLNQRLEQVETNITDYKRYRVGRKPGIGIESAARKIEPTTEEEPVAELSNEVLKDTDMARIGKKYKKLNRQLEDTTQKLYRLSNYVSEYSTALQIIETGQDVGMRNDEYLADNQREMRKKLSDMETKLQDVYLHYREDMRRHGGILPEEVAPTFEYDQNHGVTTEAPSLIQQHTPANQRTVPQHVTSTPAFPTEGAFVVTSRVVPTRRTTSESGRESGGNEEDVGAEEENSIEGEVGGGEGGGGGDSGQRRTPQYFVTPPPSTRHTNSHKTRDVSSGNDVIGGIRYTPDPRITKRTTQHFPGGAGGLSPWENTVPRPEVSGGNLVTTSTTTTTTTTTTPAPKAHGTLPSHTMDHKHKEDLGNNVIPVPTFPQPKCHVTAIGPPKPIAFRGDFISGTWLRDDGMPGSPIYVTTGSDEFRQVLVYRDLWHLINNNYSSVITLPFHCAGSGHVIYLGSIYCNKKNSNRLMRYDFEYKHTTSQRLIKAGYNNTYPYTTGLATDLDFAVDESGLWVTYGSTKHDGKLTVARLNPHTLDVHREWFVEFYKKDALNTFIVCGKVYIVVQNRETVVPQVKKVFDTYTGTLQELPKPLKLEGDSLYLTMLDYNPMESALHAWGLTRSWLGELLIYDLVVAEGEG